MPTARVRVLFVLVVLAHHRRRVLHFNVTEHPTAAWTAQQIVDSFPDDTAPAYLLRDRDAIYGDSFRQRVKGRRRSKRPSRPLEGVAESVRLCKRYRSIRSDCREHVILLSERHLRHVLTRLLSYYHRTRTHLSLTKDAPDGRPVEPPELGKVIAIRVGGGLQHRYVR